MASNTTIKLLLWKNDPNKQGQFPIYISICVNRQTKYISTGKYLFTKHWDEKNEQVKATHPLAESWNLQNKNDLNKLVKIEVELAVANKPITASILKQLFGGGKKLTNIFDFVDEYKTEVAHKMESSTLDNYTKHAKKLQEYHKSRDLSFQEVDAAYLTRFELSMSKDGLGNNYINAIMRNIRKFFNEAKRKGVITHYPFDQYSIPEYDPPRKAYVSLKEMQKIEHLVNETTDESIKQSGLYFLFGCYTGLRVSDWYRFNLKEDVFDDQIRLYAKKNGDPVAMPISTPLRRLLALMEEIPLTIAEQTINDTLKIIAGNKYLNIKKKLTTHVGRHSFAITLCAEMGIPCETCAELMAITVKTCVENYYRVTKMKIMKETMAAWAILN